MWSIQRSPNLHPLIPPKMISFGFDPSASVHPTAECDSREGGDVPKQDGISHWSWFELYRISSVYKSFKYLKVTIHNCLNNVLTIRFKHILFQEFEEQSEISSLKIPWDVVFWILAVIGQSSEEINFVSDQREAVTESWTWGVADSGRLRFQPFPLPTTRLKN